MIQIAPSILAADFSRLAEEAQAVHAAGADWLHLDIMDGHYVPAITFGAPVISSLRRVTTLPFDAHLMVANPDSQIEMIAQAGCQRISVHIETCDPKRTLPLIQSLGSEAGIVVDAYTSVEKILLALEMADFALVMTVKTGAAGQKMIPNCVEKIKAVAAELQRIGRAIPIQVDGGITPETAPTVKAAGATILVVGNAIFKSGDYAHTIQQLKT